MADIKQILIGTTTYDIDAVKFAGKSEQQWLDLIHAGLTLVAVDELPAASKDTMGKLYLVPHSHASGDTKDEYITIRSGAEGAYTYAWEKIGSTDIDLSNYVTKGNYTTADGGEGATGSAGAATITSGPAGEQTATGDVSITYKKSAAATGNGGAATVDFTKASFAGTAATISMSADYTPEGSITGSQSVAAHSHTVNLASTGKTVVTAQGTFSQGSLPSIDTTKFSGGSLSTGSQATFKQGSKASLTAQSTANFLNGATVSAAGVLSFNAAPAVTDRGTFTANGNDSFTANTLQVLTPASLAEGFFSAGSLPTLGAASTTTINHITGATLNTAGAVTISGSNFGFSGTAATLSMSTSYTPTGSITGSQSIANHTHAITLTDTTVTGTASVAIANHTHSVTIANHTHSIGNHTHGITL